MRVNKRKMICSKLQTEFEVEKIISKRIFQDDMAKYCIKWKDWKSNTWEPLDNLFNSLDSVLEYERAHRPKRPITPTKGKIVKIIKRVTKRGVARYMVLYDNHLIDWFKGSDRNYRELSECEKELFAKFLAHLSTRNVELGKLKYLYDTISLN